MSVAEWHKDTLGERVVKALGNNGFDAKYFSNREQAVEFVLSFASEGAKVGIGGSMTIAELGLASRFGARGAVVLNHNAPGLSADEKMQIRRQQLVSDLFLTSTNAVTLDGWLVNVDGTGNRVAAMMFGPKKVIVITGVNKVVEDLDSALERIRLKASPMNNKRIGLPNPCTTTGICMECGGKSRICNIYSVMKRRPHSTDISVVVIGEELGY